ncbi:hypothetical protein [Pseudomonas syringae]|uniref:hypothetical protein n=1 Tax=Pseudomonas syringae TaxID=317 RepID=UPI00067B6D03|nr:hypothetical protein [Pseudomonas syringae]
MRWLARLFIALFFLLTVWFVAMPRATLNFPADGVGEVGYQWNTRNRIYRGDMLSGGRATEPGELIPREDFYTVVDWWINSEYRGCVKVIPKWYGTDIYLDADGNLDLSSEGGTDLDRVMHCTNRPEENITCRPCSLNTLVPD